jgi:hypothetical protein
MISDVIVQGTHEMLLFHWRERAPVNERHKNTSNNKRENKLRHAASDLKRVEILHMPYKIKVYNYIIIFVQSSLSPTPKN